MIYIYILLVADQNVFAQTLEMQCFKDRGCRAKLELQLAALPVETEGGGCDH